MTEQRRIVSPQEAQAALDYSGVWPLDERFARTVATEPERIRAAVVKALRGMQRETHNNYMFEWVKAHADAIEKGADW